MEAASSGRAHANVTHAHRKDTLRLGPFNEATPVATTAGSLVDLVELGGGHQKVTSQGNKLFRGLPLLLGFDGSDVGSGEPQK